MAEIVAISQQSRFHTESQETPTQDVDLKGVQLSVGDKELLVDAHLRLFSGVHYGLVGANGVGKSTLLKAMGFGLLAGFPKNIRALYVDQLEEVGGLSQRVVDVVLAADKPAMRAKREVEVLQAALEGRGGRSSDGGSSGGPCEVAEAQALRQIRYERLVNEREEAARIASKRSGARGLAARKRLVEVEEQVATARAALDAKLTDADTHNATEAATEMLNEALAVLSVADADTAEARARKILKGLGIGTKKQDWPLGQLSGGWRIRVALAQALFLEPDLLLLDEPTNHLDLPAILWLEDYLRSLESTTLLIVSHDRAFLNATVDEIALFRHRELTYHTGNYDEFEEAMADNRLHMERMKESVDKKRAHIEKSISEGVRQAKKSGDDKKLGQVASRKKKLDRLGVEQSAKGTRFKLNRDLAGYHLSMRAEVVVDRADPTSRWSLPQPEPLRHHGPLVQVEDVGFSHGTTPVLQGVTLNIQPGVRLAFVGPNGEGKTTLMRMIAGVWEPSKGSIRRHPTAVIGFFMQHHVEELRGQGDISTLTYLSRLHPTVKEQELRGHLGSFGIKGALATQSLATLSGGQVARVAMAVTVFPRPHLLILDEPTNHLDMDTIAAMIESLEAFEGSVILVSHDQYLVDKVASEVYLVKKGKVGLLEGGMEEYVTKLRKNKG